MTEETKEEIVEIDPEQLEELLSGSDSDKLPPIMIDIDDYDVESFTRGIHETSYLAGVITALMNTGVDQNFVLDYLLNKETVAHNLKVAEINREMNVEMAKNAKAAQEKYEL